MPCLALTVTSLVYDVINVTALYRREVLPGSTVTGARAASDDQLQVCTTNFRGAIVSRLCYALKSYRSRITNNDSQEDVDQW